MKYTINDKEYTEFEINKRCAELMGLKWHEFSNVSESRQWVNIEILRLKGQPDFPEYSPCTNPADTWPIIEKCWDDLMVVDMIDYYAQWDLLMCEHNCTKLVAACICFIEINEGNESE